MMPAAVVAAMMMPTPNAATLAYHCFTSREPPLLLVSAARGESVGREEVIE